MPEGKSTIENGLSLCKLHHSAYDAFIIGVTPDYIIQVRADILEEEDERREKVLREIGLTIIRFKNNEVINQLSEVVRKIKEIIKTT
jgi:predicted restriction endonuclease